MNLFYADHFHLPLPDGHRFPITKYRLLRARLAAEPRLRDCRFVVPRAAPDDWLLLAHDAGYLRRVCQGTLSPLEIRRIGFPWSPQLVERSRRSVGGTVAAARSALLAGAAANLAGGTHHAFADQGEGFCVFNDAAVAVRVMQHEGRLARALIIDCDVHQGNGTAAILRDDPSVFTFSMHGARNFPLRKQPSDLDVPLPDGCDDDTYLAALQTHLATALDQAAAELAIYIAGADPFAGDRLGRMKLTKPGLAERDRFVLQSCFRRGIPVAIVMGGGYAHDVSDIVDIHAGTILTAARLLGRAVG